MGIRILLTILSGGMSFAAPPVATSRSTVGVFLRFERPDSPSFTRRLERDVAAIFRPAGVDLVFPRPQDGTRDYHRVVIVEMRGHCTSWRAAEVSGEAEAAPLGWTRLNADGQVMPFAMLDCDQVARAARRANRLHGPLGHFSTFSRLAARVMAHELVHALLRTAEHRQTDCGRAQLRQADALDQARLDPSEIAALREIGRPSFGVAVAEKTTGGQ